VASVLGISQKLLSEAFLQDDAVATPEAFRHAGCLSTTHYIEWGDGVQAGAVAIETAHKPDYAGTWQTVATVTFDGSTVPSTKTEYVNVPGNYGAFRHRVADPVEGGTVTTKIEGS
jgi:hypothetical protein